jgi:hypothetical protein
MTMTPQELNELAARVLMDRLRGFAVVGSGRKGRVRIARALPPTEAELQWDAFCAAARES